MKLHFIFIINNSYMAIRADLADYITFVNPLATTDALVFLFCFFFHKVTSLRSSSDYTPNRLKRKVQVFRVSNLCVGKYIFPASDHRMCSAITVASIPNIVAQT